MSAPIAAFEKPVEAACGDCGKPVVRLYLWAHRKKPDDDFDHCPKGPPMEGWDNYCTVIKRETDGAMLHGESQLPGITTRREVALEEFAEWSAQHPVGLDFGTIEQQRRMAWMAARGIDLADLEAQG